MADLIDYEIADGIARIFLNRPESLNAFNIPLAERWAEVTQDAVSREEVRAIVLAGRGRSFCAGGDVRAMAETGFSGEQVTKLAHVINRGQLALLQSAIPVVAAAHGATAGGGLGILLTSDYAVAGESSKIGAIYAKVGLTPDLGVTTLLARAVGERRAMQLALRDDLLSAAEARDWGLVAEVVSDDEVLSRAETIAREIADRSAWSRGQAKRLIRQGFARDLASSLSDESSTIGQALDRPETQALVAAFANR